MLVSHVDVRLCFQRQELSPKNKQLFLFHLLNDIISIWFSYIVLYCHISLNMYRLMFSLQFDCCCVFLKDISSVSVLKHLCKLYVCKTEFQLILISFEQFFF